MLKITLLIIVVLLVGCASAPFTQREELLAKTQCPIGYHLVQNGGLEVYASKDNKKRTEIEFKCVADSVDIRLQNSVVN